MILICTCAMCDPTAFDQCNCFVDRSDTTFKYCYQWHVNRLQCESGHCHEHQITYQPVADCPTTREACNHPSPIYLHIMRTYTDHKETVDMTGYLRWEHLLLDFKNLYQQCQGEPEVHTSDDWYGLLTCAMSSIQLPIPNPMFIANAKYPHPGRV
jgi:hypothetical protein